MSTRAFINARHLMTLSRHGEALEELQKEFDSEDPSHWWLRGLALYGLYRIDDALNAAASGLRIDPENTLLLDLVARCHANRGDLVEAEQAILAALRVDPEDADLLALYALIVAKAGQIDKAKKLVAQARRIEPENASALRLEASIAVARGEDREALLRSQEMLAINPEDSHAHLLAGEVLHDRGDVDEAAEYLRTAVVSNPRDSVAAEIARENLVWRHPLMWPLRPLHRFGPAKVWIAGIVLLFLARSTKNTTLMLVAGLTWLAYVLYSWIMPPIVRRIVK